MTILADLVGVSTSHTGTGGPITLGTALTGHRTFATANAAGQLPTGSIVSYTILNGDNAETCTGVYTSGTNTLTRVFRSSTTGSALNLSGTSEIILAANAGDFPIGKQTIYMPAAAMTPRVTNGPSVGSLETSTNKVNVITLDFDPTTQEFAQFQISMPKSWDESTVTYVAEWYHPSTTTNFGVVWSLAGVALSDTNALDTAFGTAVQVTDTGGTTNAYYASPESAAVTIGNTPAENDFVVFQIARVPADGSDTMAVDARLLGIRLFYTVTDGNDA
jgi:hypothetical protein